MHKHTEKIWRTLRNIIAYPIGAQEKARDLLCSIPWYEWPKSETGQMLYRAVNAIAVNQEKALDIWQLRYDSPYIGCSFENAPYFVASRAARKTLDWHLENV